MEEKYPLAEWLENNTDNTALPQMSSEEQAIFNKIKLYSTQLEPVAPFNEEALLQRIFNSEKETPKNSISFGLFIKIAAILVVGAGMIWYFMFNNPATAVTTQQATASFYLPDASEVILNSGSVATYEKDTWEKNRKVTLKGEGFFKVAKGKKFEVKTPAGTVAVLGTQFNVKAIKNRFEVWCYEGKVQVNFANKTIAIVAQEALIIENGKLIAKPTPLATTPDWMQNKLRFVQASLEQIAIELEQKYGYKLTVAKNINSTFTGVLPADDWEQIVVILEQTFGVKIQKEKETIYTIKPIEKQ